MVSDFNNYYFLLESKLAKDNDPNNFNMRTSIKYVSVKIYQMQL